MINLLGTTQKEEIRAARLNVQLRKYVLLGAFVAVGIFAIYIVGLYLVMNDKDKAQQQLDQDKAAVGQYHKVQTDAKAYKANLDIAKKVLSSGTSYSTFITQIAAALPAGSILTDLALTDLGNMPVKPTPGTASITLHARATDQDHVLKIKENLEKSAIFENVSIADTLEADITAQSSDLERKYPIIVNVSVVVTKQKAAQ